MYRLFRIFHKWTGIVSSLVFLNIAVSGYLLLIKKDYDWIQPSTQKGVEGTVEDFISVKQLITVVLNEKHDDFKGIEDIDRIDFRPGKRVHKVRSKYNHSEIQVDAVTGEVLSVSTRTSDLLENIHDGSLFGAWAHDVLLPLTSVVLIFLVLSGLYLWLVPVFRKRARKRAGKR